MQNSGMCPPLSDGVKKTIVGAAPPKAARPALKVSVTVPKPAASAHRRGGFAKHSKGGK